MSKKKTNEQFVEDAKLIHGDKYDYSKVHYINSQTKVTIICKTHGEFNQSPNKHLCKQGCPKCSKNYKLTHENFIENAKKIHGNKYDYSKVDYLNSNTKVIIICKIHGEFEQNPHSHIGKQKHGCPKCSKNCKLTIKEFIEKAKIIHGTKYDYSKVKYDNINNKIMISCNEHGNFNISASHHIYSLTGCPKCSKCNKINTEEFIKEAKKIHGDKYDYSKVKYKNTKNKVIIVCKEHGDFEQMPRNHLLGSICHKCSGKYQPTTEEWIETAKKIHGDKYDYSKVYYINSQTKITIICKEHGDFEQIPITHIGKQKCGCPKCCKNQHSKMSIEWIEIISKLNNNIIQHALNGEEFKIPNTRFKADGFCKETNTIYEFHGDYWHGNPNIYEPNDETYFGKTFGELYETTLKREQQIKDMGFNLITMWESDWIKLNKCIRILQKKFRNSKLY